MHEQTGKTQQNKNQSVSSTITQKRVVVNLLYNLLIIDLKLWLNESFRRQHILAQRLKMLFNCSLWLTIILLSNKSPFKRKKIILGLPDDLKSGVENLSGYSMDDVKVHRNSEKPAELQAHAYCTRY